MPALTINYSGVGTSSSSAKAVTSGTNAPVIAGQPQGPAWGAASGLTYTVTNSGGTSPTSGFNCIYYGMRLPGNSGTGADPSTGVQVQCSGPPTTTFSQTWTASVSANVVTFTASAAQSTETNAGVTIKPRMIVTFTTSGGAAINVLSSNGYYFVPFNQIIKVNIKLEGYFSGNGPGGTGNINTWEPLLTRYNTGHYRTSSNICTSYKLGFFEMIPNPDATVTTPICSGDNATIALSTANSATGVNTYTFNGGNNANITGISNGNSTTTSPYVKALTNSQTSAQTTTYTVNTSPNTGCSITENVPAITVNSSSQAPTGTTGATTICSGGSTTLATTGGSNGTDAVDVWYGGVCNDAFIQRWNSQPYATSNTTVTTPTNGILKVTSTNGDPMISMYGLGTFNPNIYKYVNIRYRVISGTAGNVEIFFTNSTYSGANGAQQVNSAALVNDGSWHTISINMAAHLQWTSSNITGWRYDWATASGVTMEIDFIELSQSPIVGTGSSYTTPALSATTDYYTKKVGSCNTTTCFKTTVTVHQPSLAATGVTGITEICSGSSTTITTSGGFNGTDAVDVWYSDVCNDAFVERWNSLSYSTGGTTLNSTTNGISNITSTNGDPMINMYGLGSFDPAIYKYINIRYRVLQGNAGNVEMFFTNGTYSGANGAQQVNSAALVNDGSWHTISINMAAHLQWTSSNITGWRYDWATASGVTMEIDFIELNQSPMIGTGTSFTTPNLTATTHYYLGKIGSTCSSTSCYKATVTVNPIPDLPTVPATVDACGTANILTVVGTNGNTNRFYADAALSNLLASGTSYATSTAGTYYVTSYNATTGCESTAVAVTVTITAPPIYGNTISSYNGAEISCNGGNNGTIAITGGGASTTYVWSTGASGTGATYAHVSGLSAGNYSVTITDGNCTVSQSFNISEPPLIAATAVLSQSTTGIYSLHCNGDANGTIDVTPTGGTGTLSYSWSPGGQSTQDRTGLGAGTYTVTITDANSCSQAFPFTVTQPPSLTVNYNVGYQCNSSGQYVDGNVSAFGSGGEPPYLYSINGSSYPVGVNQFSGLNDNSWYTIYAKDANGCVSSVLFYVDYPADGTTTADCDYIYVSASGTGPLGTEECPTSLLEAFTIYAGSPARNHIFMLAGTYNFNSKITIPSGITIDGGYEDLGSDWRKNSALTTLLDIHPTEEGTGNSRHKIGIEASGKSNFILKDLRIQVEGVSGQISGGNGRGKSVYGIRLDNCNNYDLIRLNVITGNASAGAGGSSGSNGSNGSAGGNGAPGDCDGCFWPWCNTAPNAPGGSGGSGAIGTAAGSTGTGRNGGGGGKGGYGGKEGNNSGGVGQTGGGNSASSGSTPAGSAGGGGDPGHDGYNGQDGATGAAGSNGTTAPAGIPSGGYFVPGAQGQAGGYGAGGKGGGGGGGGGGQGCSLCDDGPGNAGGGGGGGGQGGDGGTGGWGGGSTYGIFAWNNGVNGKIRSAILSPGALGAGGTGGSGGDGGSGGYRGFGPDDCGNEVGRGGEGGFGGAGGKGGKGANGDDGDRLLTSYTTTNFLTNTTGIPTTGSPVTMAMHKGCTNSEIILTRGGGSWNNIGIGGNYVNDITQSTNNYGPSANTVKVYYTSTGEKDLQLGTGGGDWYYNFLKIYDTRALPVIDVFTTSVCAGSSLTLNSSTSAIEYEWTIQKTPVTSLTSPTPLFTSSSQNPTFNFGTSSAGTYQIKLRVKDECCGWSVPVYETVVVNTVPAIAGAITGDVTACQNETGITYSILAVASATDYTWTVPSGATIANGQGTTSITVGFGLNSGNVSVRPSNACGSASSATSVSVTVNKPPTVTVNGANPYSYMLPCTGSHTLTASATGGTGGTGVFGYSWSTSATSTFISVSSAATYTVNVTDQGSTCTGSASATITQASSITSGFLTWTGAVDNQWKVEGNWDCLTVPTLTDKVIIPPGPLPNEPTIHGDPIPANATQGNCYTIQIQGATILKIESGQNAKLNVAQ